MKCKAYYHGMSASDIISLVGSTISIALASVAIALSVYFYTQSKDAEKGVDAALAGIKEQTVSLDRLSSRLLSRLTEAIISPRPADTLNLEMLQRMIPSKEFGEVNGSASPTVEGDLKLIDYQVVCFYYTAIANIYAQTQLPATIGQVDPQLKLHIDGSYGDYRTLRDQLVAKESDISKGKFDSHYKMSLTWLSLVRDVANVYSDVENGITPTVEPNDEPTGAV